MDTYIQESGRLLDLIRRDLGLREKFIAYGFDDAELAIGMARQENAANAMHSASLAVDATEDEASASLWAKALEARDCFSAFRTVARATFPGLSDRMNLGVTGDVPDDLQRFVNAAHASYTAAAQAPFAEKLAKRNFAPEKLAELKADLDAIAKAGAAEAEDETTDPDAIAEAAARRAAYNELKEFMKEIKGIARAIFRKDPDMLKHLHLTD